MLIIYDKIIINYSQIEVDKLRILYKLMGMGIVDQYNTI